MRLCPWSLTSTGPGHVRQNQPLGATPRSLLADDSERPELGGSPGDDWMNELKGKHRTVFDMSAHGNGKPLTQAKNYLDGWRDGFKVPESDLNLVIGVHGTAIPVVLTDALWARFKIGEQYEVVDPSTKAPGVRNVFGVANAAACAMHSTARCGTAAGWPQGR